MGLSFPDSTFLWEGALFFLAVLIHEGGHLLAILASGERPLGFGVGLGGAWIRLDSSFLPYRKEMRIHLAGPLAGIATALITIGIFRIRFSLPLLHFFFCNFFLSSLNLLPIKGLDGYHALFSFLCIRHSRERAMDLLIPVHTFFSLVLLISGIALWMGTKNPSLIIFWFLLAGKRKSYENLVA